LGGERRGPADGGWLRKSQTTSTDGGATYAIRNTRILGGKGEGQGVVCRLRNILLNQTTKTNNLSSYATDWSIGITKGSRRVMALKEKGQTQTNKEKGNKVNQKMK